MLVQPAITTIAVLLIGALATCSATAQTPAQTPADPPDKSQPSEISPVKTQPATPRSGANPGDAGPAKTPAGADSKGKPKSKLQRLTPDHELWIDPARKLVVINGQVCLREGQLEMFACPKGTKEHESVVSVNAPAQYIHTALLAVGAEPGRPVQFDPKYAPATGSEIEVLVLWIDKEGKKHQVRAQEWVREVKTGKPMKYSWVFAGSKQVKDQDTGKVYYLADDGDLICVSNFSTATLDLPVESSQANSGLLFDAFTERIPPRGTKIRLVLRLKTAREKTPGDTKEKKSGSK